MTGGTAYAVAQGIHDIQLLRKLKKEKYLGTKESLLGHSVKKKETIAQETIAKETIETFNIPYLCGIL